jgi:hypothetical protein
MNTLFSAVRVVARCRLFAALAGLFVAPAVWATIPLYYNDGPVIYTIPGTPPPPQIDARAFFNDGGGTFTINYATYHPGTPFYEMMNTLFYTNTGTMIVNGPITTNGLDILNLDALSFGCGFKFDQQTSSQNLWSGTFYNSGNVRCVSSVDGNDIFSLGLLVGTELYSLQSFGECLIAATNIINPGVIDVSEDGLIQMAGNMVDLTGGQLIEDAPMTLSGLQGGVSLNSVGAVGVNTNLAWDPGISLGATFAESSLIPIPPYILDLTGSTAYYKATTPVGSTNYTLYRYVFLLDQSSNATASVFIDDPDTVNLGFEPGAAHIQWAGNYTDDATGASVGSYLYLTDDYLFGANTTNDLVLNGLPENFSFLSSPVQLLINPTPSGFIPLPDISISNNYAAFNATLTASTASTNVSAANPHGTITNLPGQVWITASNELNLAFTTISGANYLNLNCTNQFDGSPGAYIAMPYSDISLGVTNGFLTISNVLTAQIPEWSGTVQAFSTVFTTVDSTGYTNEYRVLIVYSALQPTGTPWIKSLFLHGTNSLVISDHLNVYGSFYSDAQSMTLNTNQLGVGATSLDGELFWDNNTPFNAYTGVGLQQMPNLLWVTNNGLLSFAGGANFGSSTTPHDEVTPPVPATFATGTLLRVGTNAVYKDQVTIGTNIYTFVKALTNTIANQVLWASSGDASLSNLVAAINASVGSGSKYSTATRANPSVAAGPVASHKFTVTARTAGLLGNMIATGFTPATSSSNLTWLNFNFLTNGANYIPGVTNYSAFVNHSLVNDQGSVIWTSYFENDGNIQNGAGSFLLETGVGILTNGSITANGDVILVATNVPQMGFNGLTISNLFIQAGHKLTILTPNLSGDSVTNNNIFTIGMLDGGGSADSGFNIPIKPPTGDLLGTTVTNTAPYSRTIYNVWSGNDLGVSAAGYVNNLALGHLVLDVLTTNNNPAFVFNGAGVGNAMYVDLLELKDGATHGNATNNYNFPWLKINTNMVVYYARAVENIGGSLFDVSQAVDQQSQLGANSGGRLRWVNSYAGYNSSTNYYYTNSMGVIYTNTVNISLAQSSTIDSDSDGSPNKTDPTPFFVPPQVNLMVVPTNVPPMSVRVQWTTIPNATNVIYYTTNLAMPWRPFTNFQYWYYGNNVAVPNPALNYFRSPQVYIANASLPDNSQETNVWIVDVMTNPPPYFKVQVQPDVNFIIP